MAACTLYRHFDKEGVLLYVGISLSAVKRLSEHSKLSPWALDITSVTLEHLPTREEAIKAETKAIREEKPLYNIQQNGDKCVKEEEKPNVADEAKQKLTREVSFYPTYTFDQASGALNIGPTALKRHIVKKELGHMVIGERNGKYGTTPIIRISGWQIIDFIEERGGCD
jgi:hypothetical protein